MLTASDWESLILLDEETSTPSPSDAAYVWFYLGHVTPKLQSAACLVSGGHFQPFNLSAEFLATRLNEIIVIESWKGSLKGDYDEREEESGMPGA